MDNILNQKFFLRPSVSIIPIDRENGVYQFFLSNTRQKLLIKFSDVYLLDLVMSLDGLKSVKDILELMPSEEAKILNLIKYLLEKNIIEDFDDFEKNNQHELRRILNFIADFVPSHSIQGVWDNIQKSVVVIVGLGAIGGWVADFLVSMGVQNFVFLDDDVVNIGNLNRSIYTNEDIGQLKVACLEKHLKAKKGSLHISTFHKKVLEESILVEAIEIAKAINTNIAVINCGDFPNVDFSSSIVNKVCLAYQIPYVIAGGYNLHLSLLGNTVIPFKTACFECIKMTLNEVNADELKGVVKLQKKERNIGSLAPLAIVSASMAANEAIRIVAKSDYLKPAMVNRRGEFNFIQNKMSYLEFSKREDCAACGKELTY